MEIETLWLCYFYLIFKQMNYLTKGLNGRILLECSPYIKSTSKLHALISSKQFLGLNYVFSVQAWYIHLNLIDLSIQSTFFLVCFTRPSMCIIWNEFLLVTLMPQVILISLFQHCNGHNKNKRHRPTVWWDWCDILKNKCKYQWHKEVEIWNSTKLLIQIERQECQWGVLWCTKYVGFFVHAETRLDFLQINI